MSIGFRGVVSGLSADTGTGSRNKYEAPESDRPVHLSTSGLLTLRNPPALSGVQVASPANNAEALQYASVPFWTGGANITGSINPVPNHWIDPRRIVLCTNNYSTDYTWTFPTPASLIAHLKTIFGDTAISAGFAWSITIISGATATTFALNLQCPAGYTTFGFNNGTIHRLNSVAGTGYLAKSAKLTFILVTTKPGEESIYLIAE